MSILTINEMKNTADITGSASYIIVYLKSYRRKVKRVKVLLKNVLNSNITVPNKAFAATA
jgi:hypothetical protein